MTPEGLTDLAHLRRARDLIDRECPSARRADNGSTRAQVAGADDVTAGAGNLQWGISPSTDRRFNNMTLVLDRYFVHRLRTVTGKDGNPLNQL